MKIYEKMLLLVFFAHENPFFHHKSMPLFHHFRRKSVNSKPEGPDSFIHVCYYKIVLLDFSSYLFQMNKCFNYPHEEILFTLTALVVKQEIETRNIFLQCLSIKFLLYFGFLFHKDRSKNRQLFCFLFNTFTNIMQYVQYFTVGNIHFLVRRARFNLYSLATKNFVTFLINSTLYFNSCQSP